MPTTPVGLDVSVLRYFTVYGPAGGPDDVMFRLPVDRGRAPGVRDRRR